MDQLNPKFDDVSNISAEILRAIPNILSEAIDGDNPFPVDIFPSPFRELIIETNKALNYPVDYTGTVIITAVSTAIGKSAKMFVKTGWYEFPALYAALVGHSGATKSHPIDMCFKVFRDMDRDASRVSELLLAEYENYMSLPKKAKESTQKPDKPIVVKTVLDNFTPEILHQRLADNKRGCTVVSDELATFLDLMNNYSKGDQSSTYLSFWSNKSTSIDRVSKPIPLYISYPFLNIIGSLQPRALRRLFPPAKTDSGFLQRFLFAYICDARKLPISDNEIDPAVINNYNEWLRLFISNNPIVIELESDYPQPKLYYWSPEAKSYFFNWQHRNAEQVNLNQDSLLGEVLNKFDIHFIRLALIMHIMEDYNTNMVSLPAVKAAASLCKYFIANAKQVLDIIENPVKTDTLPADKQQFYDALPDTFTTAEALDLGNTFKLKETAINIFIARKDLFTWVSHGKYSKR